MKPFIICQWKATNSLFKDLKEFVLQVIADPLLEIDSPELLEDQITEWLGEHGKAYKRCRPGAVVIMNRPSLGKPAIRVYCDSMTGITLYPIVVIGFKEINEPMSLNSYSQPDLLKLPDGFRQWETTLMHQ